MTIKYIFDFLTNVFNKNDHQLINKMIKENDIKVPINIFCKKISKMSEIHAVIDQHY